MRGFRLISLSVLLPALAACADERAGEAAPEILTQDPMISAALHDPLMVDRDLAYRNEANAALTIRFDHALPLPAYSPDEARAAREAARLDLLKHGEILDLPEPELAAEPARLSWSGGAADLMSRFDVPSQCSDNLEKGFAWAARMLPGAEIAPHGQVRFAAGTVSRECNLRIIVYRVPGSLKDALQYHYNQAQRSGLDLQYHSGPVAMLAGQEGERRLAIIGRQGPGVSSDIRVIDWSL